MPALLSTHLFHTITAATPDRVWGGIDHERRESGVALRADRLRPMASRSTVTAGVAGGPQLTGRVLRAEPSRLLSYSLGDTVDEPSVYVTWEICAEPAGTVVRLYVDEPDPSAPVETELAWLPVMAALDHRLRRWGTDHPSLGAG